MIVFPCINICGVQGRCLNTKPMLHVMHEKHVIGILIQTIKKDLVFLFHNFIRSSDS